MKISTVILTKNNEKTLEKAINSVEFADEIIIIDDYSSDNTLKIAKKYKTKIFKRKLNNNFAAQRNFALSKTKNNWVLFLDSDEYLSEKLIKAINSANFGKYNGFLLRRRDIFFSKKMKGGEWGNQKILRLANKTKGKFERAVHEVWAAERPLGTLDGEILHQNVSNLHKFIKKLNKYSQIHASESKKGSFIDLLLKPVGKFLFNFIIKGGFKDSTHGFIYAILMSFHSFLAWSTAWLNKK